jgi:hypothetical protein
MCQKETSVEAESALEAMSPGFIETSVLCATVWPQIDSKRVFALSAFLCAKSVNSGAGRANAGKPLTTDELSLA